MPPDERLRWPSVSISFGLCYMIVDTDIEEKDYLKRSALLPKGEKVEKKKVRSRAISFDAIRSRTR